jgi:hypothetical protein
MKFMFSTAYRVTKKKILCTSVHFNMGTGFETTYHWSSWAYNTSHADKHVARAWISFRYLSSYNRCLHWSVRTCMKIFLSYSVLCWKHKFHKAFRIWNISMHFCIPLAWTFCISEPCIVKCPLTVCFLQPWRLSLDSTHTVEVNSVLLR